MTDPQSHIAVGTRVLRDEAAGLLALADHIGAEFAGAVDLILKAEGRIIISGMGKSGHIARKIAATFASTGTPAHFVHPGEASHGDLGMIVPGDVVVILSNSGETPEIGDMVAHCARFGIPLIGMASRPESTLIRAADIGLVLPAVPEACGVGIVPTTSTTLMLALGDALAIALMESRDFTPENFRTYHPGGKLGAKLSKVRDLMHAGESLPLVGPETAMGDVLLTISQKGYGVAGVVDAGGRLEGIITDGDLRRNMAGLLERDAGAVMTRAPKTIAPEALAQEAVAQMQDRKITCLFSTDEDGRVLGLIHIHDCLRAGVV